MTTIPLTTIDYTVETEDPQVQERADVLYLVARIARELGGDWTVTDILRLCIWVTTGIDVALQYIGLTADEDDEMPDDDQLADDAADWADDVAEVD